MKNDLNNYHDFINFKIYINRFLPGLNILLCKGNIFSDEKLNEFKLISDSIIELFNSNTMFFLEKKTEFPSLFERYHSIKNGNSTCLFIKDHYINSIYAPNNIYLMCIKGYFRKGEELGVYEYISQSMNHLNYIYDIRKNLSSVENRKNVINNETFLNSIDYINFIITPFYYDFIEIFVNSLSSKIKNTQNLFFVKIVCGVFVGCGILILYFKYLRKKYLNKYIYTKAMIMLIPQNELLKGEHYAIIQNLLGNER